MKTFLEACRAVVAHCPNSYAKAYAQAGLSLVESAEFQVDAQQHTLHAQRVQALYILNNMMHWRGDMAREVRIFLKEFSKDC